MTTAVVTIDCAWLLADPGTAPARTDVRVAFDGARIASIEPLAAAPAGPRRLALPALAALANAHDHARTFCSATLGAFDDDPLFEDTDPMNLLLARGLGLHIDHVAAAGRTVVHNDAVVGIDEAALKAELLARVRAGLQAAPGSDV